MEPVSVLMSEGRTIGIVKETQFADVIFSCCDLTNVEKTSSRILVPGSLACLRIRQVALALK